MSTDHIDKMLRKKAEKLLDNRLSEAVGECRRAIGSMWEGQSYDDNRTARSMVLNLLLQDSHERAHFLEWMDAEKEHGKGRAKAIDSIHRKLATEFLDKLDRLGEEVEELRSEVDFHSHN